MRIFRYQTKEETTKEAARHVNGIFDAHAHVPILFLSSGGSSLGLLDSIELFPQNFTVGVTDERFSEDPKVNNFAQLSATLFFQKAQERGAYFIDSRAQGGEDLELFSKRMEDALRAWAKEHPGGRIVLTQGVGADGHTLGIMPCPKDKKRFEELFEGEQWVVGYKAENEYPLRATVTLPFLRRVDHSLVYMVGKEKSGALSGMLKVEGTLWETPARIVHEMKETTLFTDIQE